MLFCVSIISLSFFSRASFSAVIAADIALSVCSNASPTFEISAAALKSGYSIL